MNISLYISEQRAQTRRERREALHRTYEEKRQKRLSEENIAREREEEENRRIKLELMKEKRQKKMEMEKRALNIKEISDRLRWNNKIAKKQQLVLL